MQFKPDEYLLLSRRGSVPLPVRTSTRPRPERPVRSPPRSAKTPRRIVVTRGLARRRAALRDLRGGLRATWTAFGPGDQDL